MIIFWILLFLLGSSFPTAAHAASDALAEVDGVTITSEEVEKSLAGQLSKLEEQIYTLKRRKVEAVPATASWTHKFSGLAPLLFSAFAMAETMVT